MCKEWRLDPGAGLPDFLAWQMRTGLAMRLWSEAEQVRDADPREAIERGKQDIERGRRLMGVR